jgi:GH24 family phage-related lysozyme (muramidase)
MNQDSIIDLRNRLKKEEGCVYKVYFDTLHNPTGGIGHLLTKDECIKFPLNTVLTETQVNNWFDSDVSIAITSLDKMLKEHYNVDLESFPESVQEALTDLCFNMGAQNLSHFFNTIRLLINKEWHTAAEHLLQNSGWVNTVKQARAEAIAGLIRAAK